MLSEAETGELIRWLPNFTSLADDALTLYLWTCIRGAEIRAMEASEITEERDGLWWTVPKSKTKGARHPLATDLRVPLVGRAEAVVRRRLAEAPKGYLFPSTGAFRARGAEVDRRRGALPHAVLQDLPGSRSSAIDGHEMGAARSSAHRPHDARCTGLPDGGRGGDPRVPVACRVQTPVRPAMPTAALSPGVSLDRFAASATAEIELREGYEIELRAALDACTAPIAPF